MHVAVRSAPSAPAPGRRGRGHASVRAIRARLAARSFLGAWSRPPSGLAWCRPWRACAGPFRAAPGCRAAQSGCWLCGRSSPRRRSALASSSLPGTLRQPWYYSRSGVRRAGAAAAAEAGPAARPARRPLCVGAGWRPVAAAAPPPGPAARLAGTVSAGARQAQIALPARGPAAPARGRYARARPRTQRQGARGRWGRPAPASWCRRARAPAGGCPPGFPSRLRSLGNAI